MRTSHRPSLRKMATVLIAGLLLAGCAGGNTGDPGQGDDAAGEPQPGGVLRISAIQEMPGFDPIRLTNAGSGVERAAAVMDTLLYRDELTDAVHPKLAAGISTDDDGKTWVLELREGVNFTDGTPLDADAVVFNIERHIAPDSTSSAKALFAGLESVTASGDLEVTFTLAEPSGSFPLALTGTSTASLIGSPTALADPEAFNVNPVGAGPFMLDEWVRDSEMTLVKNPDYWAEGKPYLDGVTYLIRVDPQTRTDDLTTAGSDVAQIPAAQWAQLESSDSVTLQPIPAGGQALVFNNAEGPTADARLREAVAIAFDPRQTNAILFGGSAVWDGNISCVPFPVESPACAPDSRPEFDEDRARALVEEYEAEHGDATIEFTHYQVLQTEAEYIQQRLAEVGIDVRLVGVDFATHSQVQSGGTYEMLQASTSQAGFPLIWNRLYSGGQNWGMKEYPELDSALVAARDSTELDDRNEAWREVNTVVNENSVITWYAPFTFAMGYANGVHLGSQEHPYTGSLLVYVDSAWLER